MRSRFLDLVICFILFQIASAQESNRYKVQTVTFYNLENLFDTLDDPLTFDNDRTPKGKDRWTEEIYQAKLNNMAKVISEIGKELTGEPPAIVGVCEIENRKVLEDLLLQNGLANHSYGIIHFDSPDRRGIDVALLYRKAIFTPSNYHPYALKIYDQRNGSKRVFTRDQLVVSGYLDGDKINLIVNHWPSRSGGEASSSYKRIKAAQLNKKIIDSLFSEDPYSKIITMGDLNDDPNSPSVKVILDTENSKLRLGQQRLYNPMEQLFKKGIGSLAWRDGWNLFDQMIISSELTKKEYSSYRFYKAGVYNKSYLATPKGKYKGYPFRSFSNGGFSGGYSDHFPVYLYLIKEVEPQR